MATAWGPRTVFDTFTDVAIPDDSETLVGTITAQSTSGVAETVEVRGIVQAAVDGAATAAVVNVYRGADATGTLLATFELDIDGSTNGHVPVPFDVFDILGDNVIAQQYAVTFTQASAGGAGDVQLMPISATTF